MDAKKGGTEDECSPFPQESVHISPAKSPADFIGAASDKAVVPRAEAACLASKCGAGDGGRLVAQMLERIPARLNSTLMRSNADPK
jgi:hypothetical protein